MSGQIDGMAMGLSKHGRYRIETLMECVYGSKKDGGTACIGRSAVCNRRLGQSPEALGYSVKVADGDKPGEAAAKECVRLFGVACRKSNVAKVVQRPGLAYFGAKFLYKRQALLVTQP